MSTEKSENELAEKRRINRLHELAGECDPIFTKVSHIMQEVMLDLRCTPGDFYQMLFSDMSAEGKAAVEAMVPMMFAASAETPAPTPAPVGQNWTPLSLHETIERLFAEAPKMEGVTEQAPALDCQIGLKSGKQMVGALGKTPEGNYRFLAVAQGPEGKMMVEHFMTILDLEYVAVIRAAAKPADSGPTIIRG